MYELKTNMLVPSAEQAAGYSDTVFKSPAFEAV